MSNDVSQKCVPPQNWPTTQDANGVITSAGPPITALNRIRYKCETSHSREETDMRRKAEVLQYKKNSFKWTKKERFAYLAKHPSSRPPTNSIQTAPTGILCGDAYQSGARVIPSGNDGIVLSSPNASNVPIDPKNKVNLYYDDTVPLTNWSSQTQYTEVGAYDGEIIRYEFPVPDAIAPLILTNDKFRKALSYYFGGAEDTIFSATDYPQIGRFNSDPTKISLWNVSAVTDMSGAFLSKSAFNENIDNWDVSIVTDMSDMFYGCSAFNQTLNKWKTSSVTDMSNMLNGVVALINR